MTNTQLKDLEKTLEQLYIDHRSDMHDKEAAALIKTTILVGYILNSPNITKVLNKVRCV